MTNDKDPITVLTDYVQRSTHWQEGGSTRHDAILALKAMSDKKAIPVGSIHKAHLKLKPGTWCCEVLLYSPDNPRDQPQDRVMLYTAGSLSDALLYAESDRAQWREQAETKARHLVAVQATARVAIGHLQAVLNQSRTHDEQLAADTLARDWLTSIGSEPT